MTRSPHSFLPALVLTATLAAQGAAPGAGAGAAPVPQAAAATPAQPAGSTLRAQYQWGYAGADGQGKGTLNVLVEEDTGRTIVELQGLGERLMFLEGDSAAGYRVQIPRRKVDERAATLGAIPLPFFPQLGSPSALYRLLTEGAGAGVKVTKRDASGPVKLRYQGNDDRGKEVMVWLERKRWELQAAQTE
jgi:hypothetical protein